MATISVKKIVTLSAMAEQRLPAITATILAFEAEMVGSLTAEEQQQFLTLLQKNERLIDMQQEGSTQIWTKRFISLFITNITVFFLFFYGLVTTLPLYTIGELHQTDKEAGLLLSGFLLSAIIVRPFSGKLLDVFGKKKLLVISIIGYFLCTVLYLFIHPFGLLLGLRFVQGIFF